MWPSRRTRWLGLLALFSLAPPLGAQQQQPWPADLPRYDLRIDLDVPKHVVQVCEVVTWTNASRTPVDKIVFNAHSHWSIAAKDIGLLAKIGEILRMSPKEAMSSEGPALHMEEVFYRGESKGKSDPRKFDNDGKLIPEGPRLPSLFPRPPTPAPPAAPPVRVPVKHYFPEDNATALTIDLPEMLQPGESVTLELKFHLKLPPKKGRWGQWDGITTLVQWLPVVAVHGDEKGWQPSPFIPWHMPFFNEAGVYTVKVRLPKDQVLAASGAVAKETDLAPGDAPGPNWKEVEIEPTCVRDFALVSSARFQVWTGEADGVKIRVVAPPEHAFYAKGFVDIIEKSIPVFNQWFGPYPGTQFTIAEGCFGWNGNQAGGLVLIDDRMFNMPEIARGYPLYLVQHELCHQWFYNAVGCNGYAETWMCEGVATYFGHRLADRTWSRNNELIQYPAGLTWLPNIHRDDLRYYCMLGAWGRGDRNPPVQDMSKYGHLVNLTSSVYDRGGKVLGLIEERMGEAEFLKFMRHVYTKYKFRILLVADFQRELETYTGQSWEEFFQFYLFGTGQCDWAVDRVEIDEQWASRFHIRRTGQRDDPVRVTVYLKQQGDINEPTTLGIRLQKGDEYQVRVPIQPGIAALPIEDLHAFVTCTTEEIGKKQKALVKVEISLPCEPLQITVDPDRLLLDQNPTNNFWKGEFRFRLTPLYTQLDEVDVTNAYDRWNMTAGPWAYFSSYSDPWYTRSLMGGFRIGGYRTQDLQVGAYVAYRSDDRNIIAGADAVWDHFLLPKLQLGMSVEKSLATIGSGDIPDSRAAVFLRYVLMYGSSLYLPPFEYVETFGVMQNRGLPDPIVATPGADLFNDRTALGMHYHKNLMTPYWDAEGGFALDLTYQYGLPIFGCNHDFQEVYGQFAFVKGMPNLGDGPILGWLSDTRWAFRAAGAAAAPNNGQFFSMGGGDYFRGFDLAQRQGSMLWVGSIEWRVPLITDIHYDFVDHLASVRNIYLAPFYDVGDCYVNGHELGTIAHAVGAGLRVDVAWLGMIERTTLRFDIAKTVNGNYPVQFWFGIQHPF